MYKFFMVSGTDEVNRHNIRLAADVYAAALEDHAKESMASQLPVGAPMHFTHDMHRVMGWCTLGGLFTDGMSVKYVQHGAVPTTEQAESDLKIVQQRYLASKDNHYIQKHDDALNDLAAKYSGGRRVFCTGAVGVLGPGIAAKAFPHLFDSDTALVDKDGLVDYRVLTEEFKETHPGVFQSADRKIALVAHPFFRRSLSRRNNLNSYFLERFADCANEHEDLRMRLKLDPDIILCGGDIKYPMEFEYWIGPKFSTDIARIPAGVTQYKASERTRLLEGIALTDFWWKVPEKRADNDDSIVEVRTFEMEEVVDQASFGVSDEFYGCRYVHTEFRKDEDAITHFDGAIRGYKAEAYLARLDKKIDSAGKHAEYTKLFRIDGALSIETWKGLVSAYYRGNILVPEYLEESCLDPILAATTPTESSSTEDAEVYDLTGRLCALVTYAPTDEAPQDGYQLVLEEFIKGGAATEYLEYRPVHVQGYLRHIFKLDDVPLIDFKDGAYNVPRLRALGTDPTWDAFASYVERLCHFIQEDHATQGLETLTCAFTWRWQDLDINFSLAGDANKVREFLNEVPTIVDPSKPPSKWIELLKAAIAKYNGHDAPRIDPSRIIKNGERLVIIRTVGNSASLYIPRSAAEEFGVIGNTGGDDRPPASGPD
ncbi:MAG: hypothetical protein ACYC1L_07045 [Alphaproteobacteria bacterium]